LFLGRSDCAVPLTRLLISIRNHSEKLDSSGEKWFRIPGCEI
jgi:hypothetical protein